MRLGCTHCCFGNGGDFRQVLIVLDENQDLAKLLASHRVEVFFAELAQAEGIALIVDAFFLGEAGDPGHHHLDVRLLLAIVTP
ncbi:hypothetical protein D3C80_1922050 [compost metagenome]